VAVNASETGGQQKPSARFITCAIVLGLLLGAGAIWGANKQALGLFHDDGIYAVVAKAISQGDGYRIISLPAAPPQTKYPFLYSYLLSWLWSLNPTFPGNILLLKALNSGVLVAIFFVAIAFYRCVFPAATIGALLFSVLLCTNPIIFTYTDYVVSDLLFVLLALGGLYFGRGSAYSDSITVKTLPVAVLAGLACLTRLAAAPLVFAGVVQAVLSRGWRGAVCFTGAVSLFVVPWFLWVSFNGAQPAISLLAYYRAYDFASGDYGGVGELLAQHSPIVASNARYLLDSFGLLYLVPLMPWLAPFIAMLTAVGMIASLRRKDTFAWAFFLSSVALLLVWPFHPGRYVAPLAPLLVLFLFRGMAGAEHWIKTSGSDYLFKEVLAKLPWSPVLLILLLNGVWLSSYLLIHDEQTTRGGYGSRAPYGWAGFEESFAWIRQYTPSEARLGTAYDPMYFLYTGRRAIRPALHRSATYFYPYGEAKPNVGSVKEVKPELEKMRIDYLIIDPLDGYAEGKATMRLLDEIVMSYGEVAKLVFTSSDGKHRIYALKREKS
jgi:hypothetical protein